MGLLLADLLLLTAPLIVLPLVIAPLATTVYGRRAVQRGRRAEPLAPLTTLTLPPRARVAVPSTAAGSTPPLQQEARPTDNTHPSTPVPPVTLPSRPSQLSRRQVLVGSAVTGGLAVGGVTWLVTRNLVPADLPDALASLGFVLRRKGCTKYILPPLVHVPEGEFLMGSDPAKEAQALSNEQPQSRLMVGAFEIAKHSVTVAEYAAFVQQTDYSPPPDYGDSRNPSWMTQQQQPDHPVTSVTWFDATLYAEWLARRLGEPWRLPTEAEWEKAARGTDGRIYPWGDRWEKTRANTSDGGPGTTTPVGTYPTGASPYGTQDLVGNVSEWTSSLYRPYPYRQNDGRERPYGTNREARVLRGGSWEEGPSVARAAGRSGLEPLVSGGRIGFRLVRAAAGS